MTVKTFQAVINFKVNSDHPDIKYISNVNKELNFSDIYTLDTDNYNNEKEMINFIKNDLMLVAGGGYSKEFIRNISFDIKRIK